MYDYSNDPRYQTILDVFKNLGLGGHERFYELIAQMACTHSDKNHDYAGHESPLANFYACEKYGIPAVDGLITRITDKDERFRRWFIKQHSGNAELKVVDESITDTLVDRAVYTLILILIIELDNQRAKTGSSTMHNSTLDMDQQSALNALREALRSNRPASVSGQVSGND